MNTSKTCGECGTSLRKNRFGYNDCYKCNMENFFLMSSKTIVPENIEIKTTPKKGEVAEEVLVDTQ